MKKIVLLGSTGSIGHSTLQVVRDQKDRFDVVALAARSSLEDIIKQAEEFSVKHLCLTDPEANKKLKDLCAGTDRKVYDSLEDLIELEDIEIVVGAVVGAAGMEANLKAVERGVDLALANKETLIMAGDLVMQAQKKSGSRIFPVDSEHSAIWQCLWGQDEKSVESLTLTASGGPFLGRTRHELEYVTFEEALKHPTWKMGPKITIDSATLMNKGLEVIEAKHLFAVDIDKINVRVHPQSIIHSLVTFHDGSVLAQLGLPDMKLPIQVALAYPERLATDYPRLDLSEVSDLTFCKPDCEAFPCLSLAFEAAARGGTAEAVLNAANEMAVERFLKSEIGFLEIPEFISKALEEHPYQENPDLEDLKLIDGWARVFVRNC